MAAPFGHGVAEEMPGEEVIEHLSEAFLGALYIAQCRDCGLNPTQNGARRFLVEVRKLQGQQAVRWGERDAYLPGLRLGLRSSQILARGLSHCSSLHLHGNAALSDAGALALLGLLEHGTIRALDLGVCGLGPSFAPALARYMIRAPLAGAAFERLELGGPTSSSLQKPNQLRGISALAAVLQQRSPRLSALGLSHNGIGSTGEGTSCMHALAALAANLTALASLDIAANGLGRAAAPLLELLPVYPSLTELDVSGNELSDWGAETLSAALLAAAASGDEMRTYVKGLSGAASTLATSLFRNPQARARLRGRQCQLRTLSVGDNRITVVGARALAIAVASCASLSHLTLSDNPLTDVGVAAIASAIAPDRDTPGWDSARGIPESHAQPEPGHASTSLETLGLCGCGIGAAGAAALAGVIARGRLTTLRLARNALGDEGVAKLARGLEGSRTLTCLDASACRISDASALALLAAAGRNDSCTLRALRLHSNQLTDEGGQAMVQLLLQSGGASTKAPVQRGAPTALAGGGESPRRSTEEAVSVAVDARTVTEIQMALSLDRSNMAAQLPRRCKLHTLTVHGNQLSYTTSSQLRDLCAANKKAEAVKPDVNAALLDLSANVPALHLLQHKLKAEAEATTSAEAELAALEAELASLRSAVRAARAADEGRLDELCQATAASEEEAAVASAALAEELSAYEAEKLAFDVEITDLVARRLQLEQLDTSARPTKRPESLKAAPPGNGGEGAAIKELPPLDARLRQLLEDETAKAADLADQDLGERRAYAMRLWSEAQIAALDQQASAAKKTKSKPQGKKGAGK